MLGLKLIRLHRKLTQAQFARLTGLGDQHDISDIELGRLKPTLRQLERASVRLGLDPKHADDLMYDFGEPLRPEVQPTEGSQPTTVQ